MPSVEKSLHVFLAVLILTLAGREKKSVHGSTGSPRTGTAQCKFKYLAVRPERVEGRSAIFSHDRCAVGRFGRIELGYCLPLGTKS